MIDVNSTYSDHHFIIYTNIKSLCYSPEANIMLYVNYISILKKAFEKDMQITYFETMLLIRFEL